MARSRRQKIRQGLSKARPVRASVSVGQNKPANKPQAGLAQRQPAASGGGGGGGGAAGGGVIAASSPLDSVYYQDLGGLERRRDTQLGEIATGRDLADRSYGFGSYADTKANPYSQAALLQDRQQLGQRGVRNSAGLQLYSGSTRQKQQGVDVRYAQALTGLKETRDAKMADYDREEGDIRREFETGDEEARQRALERAAAATPEPVAAPAGGGAPSGIPANQGKHKGKGKKKYGIGGRRPAR